MSRSGLGGRRIIIGGRGKITHVHLGPMLQVLLLYPNLDP